MIFCYGSLRQTNTDFCTQKWNKWLTMWKWHCRVKGGSCQSFFWGVCWTTSSALIGLLIELWPLNTILGEISEEMKHMLLETGEKVILWRKKARTNESVWKCLGGPKDALELTGSLATSRTPILMMRWPEGAAGTLCQRELTMALSQESEKLDKVRWQGKETVGLAAAWY